MRFYFNQSTQTIAFALIEEKQRIWGIDRDNRYGWHAHPERVILFGSAARGEMQADSDVDVVVVTPEDVERYRDTPELVIAPALRDGRIIYERPALSTG